MNDIMRCLYIQYCYYKNSIILVCNEYTIGGWLTTKGMGPPVVHSAVIKSFIGPYINE